MSPQENRDALIESLLTKPDSVQLFHGQKADQPVGMHFTPDEAWVKNFGTTVVKMTLPVNALVKLLAPEDFEKSMRKGISDEDAFWQTFFDDGYDAIIGTDSRNSMVIDVIVNPKHLQDLECR